MTQTVTEFLNTNITVLWVVIYIVLKNLTISILERVIERLDKKESK